MRMIQEQKLKKKEEDDKRREELERKERQVEENKRQILEEKRREEAEKQRQREQRLADEKRKHEELLRQQHANLQLANKPPVVPSKAYTCGTPITQNKYTDNNQTLNNGVNKYGEKMKPVAQILPNKVLHRSYLFGAMNYVQELFTIFLASPTSFAKQKPRNNICSQYAGCFSCPKQNSEAKR
jgi:hypothetical protein